MSREYTYKDTDGNILDASKWQLIETAPQIAGPPMQLWNGYFQTTGCWNYARHEWCHIDPRYSPYPHDEQPTHWKGLSNAPE